MVTLGRCVLVSLGLVTWMSACSSSSTDSPADAGSDTATPPNDAASAIDSPSADAAQPADAAQKDSATTDAGVAKSAVDGCQYDSINTTDCASGKSHYYECPAGDALPEPGCVRPTTGTNVAIRWCCPDALCSVSSTISTICGAALPSKPHGFNCDPATPGVSVCAAQAANSYCCP